MDAEQHSQVSGTSARIWFIRFLLLTVTLLVVAIIGELFLRAFYPQDLNGSWREFSNRGISYNRANTVSRQRFGERDVGLRFNEWGMRGPSPGNGRRVLVLGDSYTFGWLLDEQDTYVQRLSAASAKEIGPGKFEFLNGAAGGWGTADYLGYLEDVGVKVAPNYVLVYLNFDDIARSTASGLYETVAEDSLELRALSKSNRLTGLKKFVSSLPGYDFLLMHSHLVQFVRATVTLYQTLMSMGPRAPTDTRKPAHDTTETGTQLGKALFRRLKQWCLDHRAQLLVVSLQSNPFRRKDYQSAVDLNFYRQAAEFFKAESIPYKDIGVEIQQVTAGNESKFIIPKDGHPNAESAKLIASSTWAWLKPHLVRGAVSSAQTRK